MNKGRILHILKYYRPHFAGEGVFLERSSAVMQELAPEIEHDLLVTNTPRPAEPPSVCSTLRHVFYLTSKRVSPTWRQVVLVWWFVRNMHRYDIIHYRCHADWYFVTYLLSALTKRRLVLSATLDDSVPVLVNHYRPSLRAFAMRGFQLFDAFISISPKLFQQTSASGVDPARCHLVACGITLPPSKPGEREALRASLGIAPEDPVLLFVGGLCERKDPRFLIDAMPGVLARHPRARLILVGPPIEAAYVHAMEQAVAAARIGHAVVFAGERLDPHPWFEAADIMVFASRLEGFGTVVPEAMAHGLPVVVRHLPGVNDDFVKDGETGFLFNDAGRYLDTVFQLAADPALRARIGAAGKALATARFGMRQAAARYLSIYGVPVRKGDADHAETGLGYGASITDSRFHAPTKPANTMAPLLLTTVDAEEAFDWSGPFSRCSTDVSSMACQHLAHRVFSRHGVKPLYLADYPVAAQDAGRGPLRELLQSGLCEIGAHMHPWVTPPFVETPDENNSYAGNLPAELELEKARRLTDALAEAFGEIPRIYRTGRYGAGHRTGDVLKALGYQADSSLAPCWPTPALKHSPAAWATTPTPYWTDPERTLLEIPVSAALVGRLARHGAVLAPWVFHRWPRYFPLAGAMSRLGLLERIRLTPEGMTVPEAKRLVHHMLGQGHRVFLLTYHSPSLQPGNTPYVRTPIQRDRFLDWLDEFYTFFREEIGGRNGSWRDVRFGNAQGGMA
ncbi:glycosyltransferase, group 1 family protein [Acetobacteraceae bacterium AT-5844]|nr:glycosyltransferase, group 1 family protein [Acetobacteraceae bacterium AT-5844]